jgi:alkaline phosphatase D
VTVTDVNVREPAAAPTYAEVAEKGSAAPIGQQEKTVAETIDVEETIVLQEKPAKFWRTLLTGLPSPTSSLLSLITFLINVALVAMATDLIYRAKTYYPSHDVSFARVGYVSDNEAKLLIREPNATNLPIHVSVRFADDQVGDQGWHSAGAITTLSNETDYTTAITVPLPRHSKKTKFQYVTSNNHTGTFTSAVRIGYTDNDGPFTFLTSSCITPRFPYNPLKHPLNIPGLKHLANLLPKLNPQFMLFLGDFIYIDVPKRFGSALEDYRRGYRQVYASPDWEAVNDLPWIHVIDDHEITNDFDSNSITEAAEGTQLYQNAISPWYEYQGAANPPKATKANSLFASRDNATYFSFLQGPASFFLLDTRKYRDQNSALAPNATGKTMLGREQLEDLLAWLKAPVPHGVRWKIMVSSVPFTKNWRVNGLDTWAGFLDERQKILEAMWDVGLKGGVGVVVLSGDRHEFAATAFPPPAGGKWPLSATVHEFSTSPLSQFYLPVRTYKQVDEEDVLIK